MAYLRITEENIDREHICCAMSNKKSDKKKEWLRDRFKDGLVFYRSIERGKCFIEYMPAENAWHPLHADGYMHINCLWVSGALKGHGYSTDLLNECIATAKAQGRKGLSVLSSTRKKGFLADPKYLRHQGFLVADESDVGIQLWYLPFDEGVNRGRVLCSRTGGTGRVLRSPTHLRFMSNSPTRITMTPVTLFQVSGS